MDIQEIFILQGGYNMDEFYYEESNPKHIFINCLIILFIIGLIIGIFLYVKNINTFKLKNIDINLGDKLSNNIEDYIDGSIKNIGDYKLYLDDVDVNKVGKYTYKVKYKKHTEEGIIEIIDDGIGMDYADLARKYVWIGRNKRNDADLLEDEKKNVMGRKGIGKLAALYLSNDYYILTKKRTNNKVDQWQINLSKYDDSDFPKLDRVNEEIILKNNDIWKQMLHGTAIVLNNVDLRRNGAKRIEALKRVFADFYLIDELSSNIYVAVKTDKKQRTCFEKVEKFVAFENLYAMYDNTDSCQYKKMQKSIAFWWASKYPHIGDKERETILWRKEDFQYKGKKEFKTENGELIEKEYELVGWIGVHATIESKHAVDEKFIRNDVYQPNRLRIYVRNKLAVADFFEMHPSTQAMSNYVEGDITFNILDDDDLPDIATSSRQDFLDDERVELLISLLDPIVNAMFKVRNEIGQKIRSENEEYEE